MNQATFSFNKWNTILGWVSTNSILTYTVEPTMSFGIVVNILLRQNYKLGHQVLLVSND
jgi:hypothetical protein